MSDLETLKAQHPEWCWSYKELSDLLDGAHYDAILQVQVQRAALVALIQYHEAELAKAQENIAELKERESVSAARLARVLQFFPALGMNHLHEGLDRLYNEDGFASGFGEECKRSMVSIKADLAKAQETVAELDKQLAPVRRRAEIRRIMAEQPGVDLRMRDQKTRDTVLAIASIPGTYEDDSQWYPTREILIAERDSLRSQLAGAQATIATLRDSLQQRERELEEADNALSFYADPTNMDEYAVYRIPHEGHKGCKVPDAGRTARTALDRIHSARAQRAEAKKEE